MRQEAPLSIEGKSPNPQRSLGSIVRFQRLITKHFRGEVVGSITSLQRVIYLVLEAMSLEVLPTFSGQCIEVWKRGDRKRKHWKRRNWICGELTNFERKDIENVGQFIEHKNRGYRYCYPPTAVSLPFFFCNSNIVSSKPSRNLRK